jgi:hypothetical protein
MLGFVLVLMMVMMMVVVTMVMVMVMVIVGGQRSVPARALSPHPCGATCRCSRRRAVVCLQCLDGIASGNRLEE